MLVEEGDVSGSASDGGVFVEGDGGCGGQRLRLCRREGAYELVLTVARNTGERLAWSPLAQAAARGGVVSSSVLGVRWVGFGRPRRTLAAPKKNTLHGNAFSRPLYLVGAKREGFVAACRFRKNQVLRPSTIWDSLGYV